MAHKQQAKQQCRPWKFAHPAAISHNKGANDRFALLCTSVLSSRCTTLTHEDRSHSTQQTAPTKNLNCASFLLAAHHSQYITYSTCTPGQTIALEKSCPRALRAAIPQQLCEDVHNSRGPLQSAQAASYYCTHSCRVQNTSRPHLRGQWEVGMPVNLGLSTQLSPSPPLFTSHKLHVHRNSCTSTKALHVSMCPA